MLKDGARHVDIAAANIGNDFRSYLALACFWTNYRDSHARPGGEVAVALSPVRALELAKELLQPAVVSIKTNQWGDLVAGVATGTETRPHRLPRAERPQYARLPGPRLVLSS